MLAFCISNFALLAFGLASVKENVFQQTNCATGECQAESDNSGLLAVHQAARATQTRGCNLEITVKITNLLQFDLVGRSQKVSEGIFKDAPYPFTNFRVRPGETGEFKLSNNDGSPCKNPAIDISWYLVPDGPGQTTSGLSSVNFKVKGESGGPKAKEGNDDIYVTFDGPKKDMYMAQPSGDWKGTKQDVSFTVKYVPQAAAAQWSLIAGAPCVDSSGIVWTSTYQTTDEKVLTDQWTSATTVGLTVKVNSGVAESVAAKREVTVQGSESFTKSGTAVIRNSITQTTQVSCKFGCQPHQYMWTYMYTSGLLEPRYQSACAQSTCSWGGKGYEPQCPYGYCIDGSCQCCTSLEWAADPTNADVSKLLSSKFGGTCQTTPAGFPGPPECNKFL